MGTIAAHKAGDVSSLEGYIRSNGPMNWRACLAQFHDVCFSMETGKAGSTEIGELSIHSFIVRNTDTAGGIVIEIQPEAQKIDREKQNGQSEFSFPKESYMSPERCLDRPVNRRSDIYSLGCVIYHCLTGAPPFMHRDLEKLKEMQTIDYALPPGRRSQRRVIPDEVDMVILNCLEKDPAKRFRNVGTLRANIGQALQIDEDSDEPPVNSSKFADFSKRKRKILISVAALVALTAGLGAWSLSTTSSDGFQRLVERTLERKRNKYYLSLEHGPQFMAQAEYENGKMLPDNDKDPIYIKVKDQDVILFTTTKRKTVKAALEEAVRRRIILFNADLIGQNLQGATLRGGNFDHSIMIECDLNGADFRNSFMKGSIFAGSNMKGANLTSVNSPEAVFQGCNLEGANLSGSVLLDCDFTKSNLKNADLSYSTFLNSSFQDADLTGANLKGATMAKIGFPTANLSESQKAQVTVIEGPLANAKQLEAKTKGLNLVAPPVDNLKMNNPFSNPVEGTSAFGPSKDEPVGLEIDLENLPPEPPRRRGAPPPPPLQPAIPGKPITPGVVGP